MNSDKEIIENFHHRINNGWKGITTKADIDFDNMIRRNLNNGKPGIDGKLLLEVLEENKR